MLTEAIILYIYFAAVATAMILLWIYANYKNNK